MAEGNSQLEDYRAIVDPINSQETDTTTQVKKKRFGVKRLFTKSDKSKSGELPSLEKQQKLFREVLFNAGKKKSAQINCTKEINEILEQLDEDDREAVILEKFEYKKDKVTLDMDGIQFALRFKLYKLLRILFNNITVGSYLENHELLEQAILSGDDKQLRHIIQMYQSADVQIVLPSLADETLSYLYEQSWNKETIEALYPYTRSYLIPRQQKKAKMFAFVCYNTFDVETATGQKKRDGAREEADIIITGFENCGFTVRGPLIDWTFEKLLEYLEVHINEVKNDCSVIFICIMSHGDQGVIYDKDGKIGEINKILSKLYLLKAFLPVVVLLQACQGDREPNQQINLPYRSSQPDSPDQDALTGGPGNQPPGTSTWEVAPYMYGVHISVLRPNTMVVTATAEYHKATRKIFLTHFSKELEYADGMTTVDSMVQLCSKNMSLHTDEDRRRQAPLTYGLLRQPLILPLAAAFDKKMLEPQHHSSRFGGCRTALYIVNELRKIYAKQAKDKLKKKKK